MMEMLSKIKQYVSVLIAIAMAVKEMVQLFEVPKHGEEKTQAVKEGVRILVHLADEFFSWIPEEKVLSVTDGMVEICVKFNNLVGAWKKPDVETVVGNS